jgi:hypothetical protein
MQPPCDWLAERTVETGPPNAISPSKLGPVEMQPRSVSAEPGLQGVPPCA